MTAPTIGEFSGLVWAKAQGRFGWARRATTFRRFEGGVEAHLGENGRVVRVLPIDGEWSAGYEVYVFGNQWSMVVVASITVHAGAYSPDAVASTMDLALGLDGDRIAPPATPARCECIDRTDEPGFCSRCGGDR